MRILTESGLERIFEPLHVQSSLIIHQHDIEATRRGMALFGEIILRRADQALLLVDVHAACRAAKIAVATLPDLDENQHFCIQHDQIDFAKTAAKILRHRL